MALSGDSNFFELANILSEEVYSDYRNYVYDKFDTGHMVSRELVEEANINIFRFDGIFTLDSLFPMDLDNFKELLEAFYSGSTLRVYRDWPSTITPFSEDSVANLLGYSDLVATGDTTYYGWESNVLGRYKFTIEGYGIKVSDIIEIGVV